MTGHINSVLAGRRRTGGVFFRVLCLIGLAATVAACGGTGGDDGTAPPKTPGTMVSSPLALNLYPVDATSSNPARLFIFVTAVGSQPVSLPLGFDTGSAGITLNALSIFPSSMVTPNGFNFGGGSSLSYNGITVTPLQGTRTYGGSNGRTQIGNLGFATVTFGDTAGSLTTQTMPVFLYYAVESNATPPQPLPMDTQDGWFGVNAAPNMIKLGGSTSNAPECTPTVTGNCWVAGVFKYLNYASGIDAGFIVSPSQVLSCDITSPGSCVPVQALTVGLDSHSADGFSTALLPCPPAGYTGPSTINGYPLCQEYVPGTSIFVTGSPDETLTASVLFDTGTPVFVLNVPSGTALPSGVASLQVTTPSGFMYSATVGSGLYAIQVQQAPSTTSNSVIGLAYFETNSLLIDFVTGTQGWK